MLQRFAFPLLVLLFIFSFVFMEARGQDVSYPISPRFENPDPKEAEYIDQIRAGILSIQEKEKQDHGKYLRGTHSKGTCLSGKMEIYNLESSGIAKRIKKGIFAVPATYPVDVRFANAEGFIQKDFSRDVRAVSLSVKQMPAEISNPQGRMDFTFNDATTFPINNAQVFADIMRTLSKGVVDSAKDVGTLRELEALRAVGNGKVLQEGFGWTAYQQKRYWSTVPFALGSDEAVKYSLNPCPGNLANSVDYTDPDGLKNELIRHVNEDKTMSCFELEVQLLDAKHMTHLFGQKTEPESWWVENAVTEWNEAEAPFYPVGKLTLVEKSIVDQKECDSRWVSVTINNNLTHHGLGSINRARSAAEKASADKRLNQ